MDENNSLLKAEDVARLLNISRGAVYKFAHAGMLPFVQLGRAMRFRPESIDKLLDRRERAAFAKLG